MSLPPKTKETWHLLEAALPQDPSNPVVMVFDIARGTALGLADGAGALPTAFRNACSRPTDRRPRRPTCLQVEDEATRKALTGIMPGVSVVVVERPPAVVAALARLFDMTATMKVDMTAWGFERPLLKDILRAGVAVEEACPWVSLDDEPIVVEAPELGLPRGALVVMGQNQEQFGFVLYDSPEDADVHAEFAATAGPDITRQPVSYLVFDLELARELPKELTREAAAIVGKRKRYPCPSRVTEDLEIDEANPLEAELLAAVGQALAAMVQAHRAQLEMMAPLRFEHGQVTLYVEMDVEGAEVIPFPGFTPEPPADEREDFALLREVVAWSWAQGGLFAELIEDLGLEDCKTVAHQALRAWPWVAREKVRGRTLIDHFRDANALDAIDQGIIASHAASWTGYWEALEVDPGVGMLLRDWVSGEELRVSDATASQSVKVHTILCARLVTTELAAGPVTLLGGLHPVGLPPTVAHRVLAMARERLRWPATKTVTVARARHPNAQFVLVQVWEASALAIANAPPPTLVDPSGEELVLVEDRYALTAPVTIAQLLKSGAFEAMAEPDRCAATRPAEERFPAGDVHINGRVLTAKAVTRSRADALRQRLEQVIGKALVFESRREETLADIASGAPAPLRAAPTPEEQAAVRAYKEQFYATWPDIPVPALDDRTPRAAVRSKSGRAAVDRLLREMTQREASCPPGERFDFDVLRRELGLT